MRHLIFLFGVLLKSTSHAFIFQLGPPTLEIHWVDSNVILRGSSDIECAIITPFNSPYNYAFVVRDRRCYVCRTADAIEPYRADERLLQGPHNLRGGDDLPGNTMHYNTNSSYWLVEDASSPSIGIPCDNHLICIVCFIFIVSFCEAFIVSLRNMLSAVYTHIDYRDHGLMVLNWI